MKLHKDSLAILRSLQGNRDTNGIEWELFSPEAQDEKIVEIYGVVSD